MKLAMFFVLTENVLFLVSSSSSPHPFSGTSFTFLPIAQDAISQASKQQILK